MGWSVSLRRALSHAPARRFLLVRAEDMSGVSGTGIVAEGVAFSTGKVVLAWIRPPFAIGIFESVFDLMAVHGHQGKTKVRWIDQDEREESQAQKLPVLCMPLGED